MIRTCELHGKAVGTKAGKPRSLQLMSLKGLLHLLVLASTLFLIAGCGMFNLGKWKGIEKAGADEKYYLVKDVFLTAGSAYNRKETFDHNMNESVNLIFTPKMEPNTYTVESIWYDSNGEEFRKIRKTYDAQKETSKGEDRQASGSTRVHTMSTKELYDHKPGLWKVELYIEKDLVRRLPFAIR
jgi:hypothetical protein